MNSKSLAKSFASQFFRMFLLTFVFAAVLVITTLYLCSIKSYTRTAGDYTKLLATNIQPYLSNIDSSTDNISPLLAALEHVSSIDETALVGPNGNIIYSWARDKNQDKILEQPIRANTVKQINGHIVTDKLLVTPDGISYSVRTSSNISESYHALFVNLLLCYLAMLILLSFIIFLAIRWLNKEIIIPVVKLYQITSKIVDERNLAISIPVTGNNEITILAETINSIMDKIRKLVNVIKDCSAAMSVLTAKISQAGNQVCLVAANTHKNTISTQDRINGLMGFFNQVSTQVGKLSKHSDDGAATVYQMNQSNQTMITNIYSMNKAVEQAVNSIDQVTISIQTNADSINNVHDSLDMVSYSMQNILTSVTTGEEIAKKELELSKQLTEEAQGGFVALEETIQSLELIKESAHNVADKLADLRHYAVDIGNTLHDIEDITKQTNLLSVNAAILSAQAGEHGRGFAVVSGEIDALASRIQEATKKISSLVTTIQEESRLAIRATRASFKTINNGSQFGDQAINAYTTLMDSADRTADHAKIIAASSATQAEEVRTVSESIDNLAKTVEEINQASQQQAEEAVVLTRATELLSNNNKMVENSSHEQERSAENVLNVINNFNSMATDAKHSQQDQSVTVKKIIDTVSNIKASADSLEQETTQLDTIISSLNSQIDRFASYISQFQT